MEQYIWRDCFLFPPPVRLKSPWANVFFDLFFIMLQIEDDAYQEDLGFSLGQLGKSGSGRVRQAQVNEATKARISKSLQVDL